MAAEWVTTAHKAVTIKNVHVKVFIAEVVECGEAMAGEIQRHEKQRRGTLFIAAVLVFPSNQTGSMTMVGLFELVSH